MENQNEIAKEIRLHINPDNDEKQIIDNIRKTAASVSGLEIDELKIVITENGQKEIIVPFKNPVINEDAKKTR